MNQCWLGPWWQFRYVVEAGHQHACISFAATRARRFQDFKCGEREVYTSYETGARCG